MTAPVITTARLRLRALTPDDAADLAERRSDPITAQFQAWTVPYPVERAAAMIAGMIEQGGPALGAWWQFGIERIADGVLVGDAALHLMEDGRNGEIGYTLHRWARGNGYATEAAAAVIDYAFTEWGLHRVEAEIDPRNAASVAVLERLGFRHEGTQIESYWVGDVVSDSGHYGLLRREWEAHRAVPRDQGLA